ncbi:MAG TPA: hypothetical protein VES19_02965 [Candidatus Limnocylindrales bacterium]|nr:hypothetical protein [Candidatus Limnocylindrales bacterium]
MTAMTMRGRAGFDLRLACRLHRFEILGFGVLVAFLAAAAIGVAGLLDATGYGRQCVGGAGAQPVACEAMGRDFYGYQQSLVPMVQGLLAVVPFLLAALVGTPLVARELERGTSRLAWSLAPSRVRWFVVRIVPAVVFVFVLALLAGLALDRLTAAVEPGTDAARSFAGFGSRGIVLAARAVFVLAIAVCFGALLGRMLPALLLAAVVGWIGLAGGSYVHSRWLATEAVISPTEIGSPGDLFIDQRIKAPDGRIMTWDEIYAELPPTEDGSDWPPAGHTFVSYVVPAERLLSVQAREVAALAGASLVFLGFAAVAVGRRRPG